jgi:dsDNA-binding SOS-regulon protein
MTFTSKAEADAYDKLLDTAEALYEILDQSELAGDHSQKEALSMYLAQNKDSILSVFSNKKKSPQKTKKANKAASAQLDLAEAAPKKPLEDLVIEPDEDMVYDEEESSVVFDDELADFRESDAA